MTPLKMGVMGLVVFILVVLFLGMLMKGASGFEGFQEGTGAKCSKNEDCASKHCTNGKCA